MVQVFCEERGSGKTKRLIERANNEIMNSKGEAVYIDYGSRNSSKIDRKVRFVSAKEFKVSNCESLYGLLCGILSQNYDIENIYIDELLDIVSCDIKDTEELFQQINLLSSEYKVKIFININSSNKEEIPLFLKLS